MAGLSMKTQIAAKIEAKEGVAETLAATDLLPVLSGGDMTPELPAIDRERARDSLTHDESIPGLRSGTLAFRMELAGPTSGFSSNPGAYSTPLRACGMRQKALKFLALAASWSAGTVVQDGETFTAAPSGATGKVWADWQQGDSYLAYEVTTGVVASGDTLTFSGGAVVPAAASFSLTSGYGWRPEDQMLSSISISAVSGGPITAGEALVGGTSGAVGICRQDTSGAGAQTLIFERVPGGGHFSAGETISVPGSAKTATVGGSPSETQTQVPSLTLGALHDNLFIQQTRGSRGTWSLDLTNGERGILSFQFTGVGIQPQDASLFDWASAPTILVPPVVHGGLFTFDKTFVPNFHQLTLEIGNTLALREAPGDTTAAGYESAVITSRRPRGSIDPEAVREATYAMGGKAWAKTAFRLAARIGSTSSNIFEVRCRKTQIESPRNADRAGIRTRNLPLLFNGSGDDEIILFVK